MKTYNCGVVQKIVNREYEIMSHKWHNPEYNIIATNIMLEGGKTLQICYNRSLKGKSSVTLYWHRGVELEHYLSRHYDDLSELPTKYHPVVKELLNAYTVVNFDSLEAPRGVFKKETDGQADLLIKIPKFTMQNGVLYCDVLIRGAKKEKFLTALESIMHKSKPNVTKNEDGSMYRVGNLAFDELHLCLIGFMKTSSIKINSGVNLDNIPDYAYRLNVIDLFKKLSTDVV